MNQRQRRLLLYLLSQKHYQPIQELCEEFGFSEKTIRNDIKAVNAYLHMNKTASRIETKRGSGVRMHLEEREEEYVRYLLESRVLEIKPDLDRFYHGMLLLLFTQELYTMDTLADELYTNRLQLKEDLLCWESMLKMFQLNIVKGTHLHIEGEERQIRLFVLYYFYQRADKAMIMSIEPVLLQEHKSLFRSILRLYEEAYGYRFTVNALHHFSIYLGIMMKRIQMGKGLRKEQSYQNDVKAYDFINKQSNQGVEKGHALLKEQLHQSDEKASALLREQLHQSDEKATALLKEHSYQGEEKMIALLKERPYQGEEKTIALLKERPYQVEEKAAAFLKERPYQVEEKATALLKERPYQVEEKTISLLKEQSYQGEEKVSALLRELPYKGNKKVRTLLRDYFHMDVNDEEMKFLEQMIESGARQWNRSMLHEFVLKEETKELSGRFFHSLEREYGTVMDNELPVLFSILLQTAIIRKQHSMRVLHYNDTQVKYDSMAEFLCVMQLFHRDEKLRALQLYESEYTRLSMLLLPYFHQLNTQVRFRAGLIVNCSLELAYYGRMRITEAIANIDIVRILTEDELEEASPEVDFFITFDYLHKKVPNVEISSIIQDSDIQKLQQYLNQLRRERAMKQPVSCSRHLRHAENEDALVLLLFQQLHENCEAISYAEFTAMLPIHRLLLRDCMLIVLYDKRIDSSFISMLELKNQLYIEGKGIRQVCLAGFASAGYERLQENLVQLKEQLKKHLPHLT